MREPTEAELPAIEKLLVDSGLPADDLREQDLSLFRVMATPRGIDAVGGLQRCGETALLRSVATSPALRGRGIAGKVIHELEKLAVRKGLESLYLLTESAEAYFESKGYSQASRSDVPDAIRASCQFSSLCPDSAKVMRKQIVV
ncbi:arsenic resistance N-acetyltransferase ArsN2 [Congregibacter litoralis]|uniref:N-acetylglutamate synthase n=1 Tax=Congregibacter litoralis KT71 TaxID=314285 RepID=A4A7N8_9GAMM|nr:arsenic resistance N-acetyltransferase ArsN2 [Congregibacter litoralis]EAQ98307.2 N-acetylglutamate synthase [Congregibacter litoralis KT71]